MEECEYDGSGSLSSHPYEGENGVRLITFELDCGVEELFEFSDRGGFWLNQSGLVGDIGTGVLKCFECGEMRWRIDLREKENVLTFERK